MQFFLGKNLDIYNVCFKNKELVLSRLKLNQYKSFKNGFKHFFFFFEVTKMGFVKVFCN